MLSLFFFIDRLCRSLSILSDVKVRKKKNHYRFDAKTDKD